MWYSRWLNIVCCIQTQNTSYHPSYTWIEEPFLFRHVNLLYHVMPIIIISNVNTANSRALPITWFATSWPNLWREYCLNDFMVLRNSFIVCGSLCGSSFYHRWHWGQVERELCSNHANSLQEVVSYIYIYIHTFIYKVSSIFFFYSLFAYLTFINKFPTKLFVSLWWGHGQQDIKVNKSSRTHYYIHG